VNYTETFAIVAKLVSIQGVMSLAASMDWEIEQVDIVGVYLNAFLEKEVYMEALFSVLPLETKDKVCHLIKALYGLKQMGCVWYRTMAKDFGKMGFIVLESDQSVFVRTTSEGRLIISVSTDDIIIAGSTKGVVEVFKRELRLKYEMTEVRELK